jgi:hypothetical protein
MAGPNKGTAVKRRAIAKGYTSSKYSEELGGTTGRSAMLAEEKWDREHKPDTAKRARARQASRSKASEKNWELESKGNLNLPPKRAKNVKVGTVK